MQDLKEIYQKGREYNMWFAVLFLIILFGGAATMLFMLYKWYQALGIIVLCVVASIIAEIFKLRNHFHKKHLCGNQKVTAKV